MTDAAPQSAAPAPADKAALEAEMAAIVAAHGPWYSSNIALPHGLSTMGAGACGDNHRAHKLLQLVADLLARPIHELRVADLGCGEGLYALEFAQRGARVVGIEGRAAHVAKADFVRHAHSCDTLEFVQDDVRNFSAEKYGAFDVILCSGILYHLDHPHGAALLRAMQAACTGLCIVDTRVALRGRSSVAFAGKRYRGRHVREHGWFANAARKAAHLGSSLDNDRSFWFTRASLANLLADLGFTSVAEALVPVPFNTRADRATFVALAGTPLRPHSHFDADLTHGRWPD